MKTVNYIHTSDPIWRPYCFTRVHVSSHDAPEFCFIGPVYSRYRSGVELFALADAAAELTGVNGHYGYRSGTPN